MHLRLCPLSPPRAHLPTRKFKFLGPVHDLESSRGLPAAPDGRLMPGRVLQSPLPSQPEATQSSCRGRASLTWSSLASSPGPVDSGPLGSDPSPLRVRVFPDSQPAGAGISVPVYSARRVPRTVEGRYRKSDRTTAYLLRFSGCCGCDEGMAAAQWDDALRQGHGAAGA
eukprot:1156679-Rhodomonas_salina.1